MTSIAFILGMLPLAISTGATSRHSMGTGVMGGILGVLFAPVFFVVVRRLLGDKMDEGNSLAEAESEGR